MDWTKLSPDELETLRTIVLPISLKLSQAEVADRLGLTEFVVSQRLAAFRERVWQLHLEETGQE